MTTDDTNATNDTNDANDASDAKRDARDEPVTISLPAVCLVLLVGVSGAGKSTFARRHFLKT
ncbi:MAG: hypothetical protein KC486_34065, partial [Myxococcales bacterium]|nr:hypothetical protein [Myxococcales bacterium]